MKFTRKLTAMILAMTMMMGMGASAMADDREVSEENLENMSLNETNEQEEGNESSDIETIDHEKKLIKIKAPKFRVKKTGFDALKVTAQKGYLKYQIQYSTKKKSGYKNFYIGKKRSKEKSLIEPGKTYYFRIRGMKKVDGKKVWSEYSKVRKKKLKRSSNPVMRWRYEVKKSLKKNHAYSKWRERAILRVIFGESKGHPGARNGQYVGLVQFGNHWKHNYGRSYFKKHRLGKYYSDNRRSAKWSIHTMAKVAKKGGNRALRQHWAATIY